MTNYRGIAIQSVILRILGKFIINLLMKHILPIISSYQHGFLKNRSTISNLLEITQYIHSHIHKGDQVDVVYFDFSKAFDTIDHFSLAKKLARFSIPLKLFSLILSFICSRKYILKIDRTPTNLSFTPSSGTPQGSHIGPLIYLLYANDIPSLFQDVNTLMYADDTKIYTVIKSDGDRANLQNAINHMTIWAEKNKLQLQQNQNINFSQELT